jgi:ergothioneine biosynthesis protein EgtB
MSVMGSTSDHRQTLLDGLAGARRHTDDLFEIVRTEALYDRPIPERHRIVFYIGHLEAFDWNLIGRSHFKLEPFADTLDRLFAFGIDPVDGGLPDDPPSAWPSLTEVYAYRDRARAAVDGCLMGLDRDPDPELADRFHVAIEHRLMHAETLAYMLHQLPYDRKRANPEAASPAGRSTGGSVVIPAGTATLGRTRGQGFGWDNEFDAHAVAVPAFTIDLHAVTNRDFLAFVDGGGYERRALWDDAAWAWKEQHGVRHPAFWRNGGAAGWQYVGMFSERALPLDAPAYVSQAEASAFARTRGATLPTEAEFHRAAFGTPDGAEREYPWGDSAPDPTRGNFDFARWEPVAAGAYPAGDSGFGVADLTGNGWEWTSTRFAPFAGFAAFPFYPGYSANFFDGHHFVMKGASARTAACMLRRSFRNWFQPHYPYVYAKFRCVTR